MITRDNVEIRESKKIYISIYINVSKVRINGLTIFKFSIVYELNKVRSNVDGVDFNSEEVTVATY